MNPNDCSNVNYVNKIIIIIIIELNRDSFKLFQILNRTSSSCHSRYMKKFAYTKNKIFKAKMIKKITGRSWNRPTEAMLLPACENALFFFQFFVIL